MTIKENLTYLQYFGFELTFWKTINRIVSDRSKGRLAWNIHNKNFEVIENYLRKVCAPVVSDLKNKRLQNRSDIGSCITEQSKIIKVNQTIWTMWWQGEELAPPVVKSCINSMRKYSNGREVIVINEHNIKEYLCIPDIFMKRLQEGFKNTSPLGHTTLTLTHFSDVVRIMLLYQYGGLWMDSTIFLTDYIPETYFDVDWIMLGEDDKWYVAEGKWSIFFFGTRAGNEIMLFLYEMLHSYYNKKKYYVTYLMIYNMMNVLYVERPDLAEIMDKADNGNKQVITINRRYDKPVKMNEIEEFLQIQHIHKLSWKWWGDSKDSPMNLEDDLGNLTWFGYLYNKYIKN